MSDTFNREAAMQLAKIEDTRLVLVPSTVRELSTFPKDTCWVVVFGVARGGKSTLCGLLTGSCEFAISIKTQPCTDGVWISRPIPQPNGTHLVIVDTEGTELGKNTKFQNKILALACFLGANGGVLLHNDFHFTPNSCIAPLAKLAVTMQALRGLEAENFPALCFRIRDFQSEMEVNGNPATPAEFFSYLLNDNDDDDYNEDRKLIRTCFPRRVLFPTPYFSPTERQHFAATRSLPAGEFATAFGAMRDWILTELSPKRIGGRPCDGLALVTFIEQVVQIINNNEVITIPSIVSATLDIICSRRAEESLEFYKGGMAEITDFLSIATEAELTTIHERHAGAAMAAYTTNTQGFFPASVDKYTAVLNNNIAHVFAEIRAQYHDAKRRKAEADLPKPCMHNFTEYRHRVVADEGHHGGWGGFLHGHKCCGRCRYNPSGRCEKSCGGKCGNPRTEEKVFHQCQKCKISGDGPAPRVPVQSAVDQVD